MLLEPVCNGAERGRNQDVCLWGYNLSLNLVAREVILVAVPFAVIFLKQF